MLRVSIVGASGYTGGELLRILLFHPEVEIHQVTSERHAAKLISTLHPNLRKICKLKFVSIAELEPCDVLFLGLPHGHMMSRLSDSYLKSLVRKGGLHWNLSGAMPASPSLKGEEIDDLVAFVRSLADPRGNGRCPCGTISKSCGASHDPGACGCQKDEAKGRLCSHMKR